MWKSLDEALHRIATWRLGDSTTLLVGRVIFVRRGNAMIIILPSGRELVYRGIHLERESFNDQVYYWGSYKGSWGRLKLWGGTLLENIVQAISYDLLMIALRRAEVEGLDPILTVHDEILCEVDAPMAPTVLERLLTIMRQGSAWAPGLPIEASGWMGTRYRK
jgi:DNA polymerase